MHGPSKALPHQILTKDFAEASTIVRCEGGIAPVSKQDAELTQVVGDRHPDRWEAAVTRPSAASHVC